MTFPSRIDVATATAINSTTLNVTMPTFYAGSLILALYFQLGSAGGTGWPAGWSTALQYNPGGSGTPTLWARYWVATCAGQGNFTVTYGASQMIALSVMSFENWSGVYTPEASSGANSSGNRPDPDALTPSGWGTGPWDVQWFALGGCIDASQVVSAWNPSYTLYREEVLADSTLDSLLQVSARNLNASSEDPGQWLNSASGNWYAATVGVMGGTTGGRKTSRLLKLGVR